MEGGCGGGGNNKTEVNVDQVGHQLLNSLQESMRVTSHRLGWTVHQFVVVVNMERIRIQHLVSMAAMRIVLRIMTGGGCLSEVKACYLVNGEFLLIG